MWKKILFPFWKIGYVRVMRDEWKRENINQYRATKYAYMCFSIEKSFDAPLHNNLAHKWFDPKIPNRQCKSIVWFVFFSYALTSYGSILIPWECICLHACFYQCIGKSGLSHVCVCVSSSLLSNEITQNQMVQRQMLILNWFFDFEMHIEADWISHLVVSIKEKF